MKFSEKWNHLKERSRKILIVRVAFIQGKDDETNEPLAQREDDRGTVLQYRLETYDKKINPVIEFYRLVSE